MDDLGVCPFLGTTKTYELWQIHANTMFHWHRVFQRFESPKWETIVFHIFRIFSQLDGFFTLVFEVSWDLSPWICFTNLEMSKVMGSRQHRVTMAFEIWMGDYMPMTDPYVWYFSANIGGILMVNGTPYMAGWWFGCHLFSQKSWVSVIIPIDELHHFSGRGG